MSVHRIAGAAALRRSAVSNRTIRAYSLGLVVADAGIVKLATTQTWDGIASFLLRI
jgi:hypothetical protein